MHHFFFFSSSHTWKGGILLLSCSIFSENPRILIFSRVMLSFEGVRQGSISLFQQQYICKSKIEIQICPKHCKVFPRECWRWNILCSQKVFSLMDVNRVSGNTCGPINCLLLAGHTCKKYTKFIGFGSFWMKVWSWSNKVIVFLYRLPLPKQCMPHLNSKCLLVDQAQPMWFMEVLMLEQDLMAMHLQVFL